MICHVCAPLLLIVLCCHTESYSALRSHGRLRHQHTTTTTSRQLSFSTSTSSTPLLRLLQHVDEPSRSELSRHPMNRFISPIEDKLSSWDIPNWLTFSRIISIPLFMVTFLNGLVSISFLSCFLWLNYLTSFIFSCPFRIGWHSVSTSHRAQLTTWMDT